MAKNNSEFVNNKLTQIEQRYDGDHDCSPDYPTVNWTDIQLVDCIHSLLEKVEGLEKEVNRLSALVYDPDQNPTLEEYRNRYGHPLGVG
jgi:hypothetical protein